MADFTAKYVNTNIASDASKYDSAKFAGFLAKLTSAETESIKGSAPAILTAILVGQRRADIVPQIFVDVSKDKSDDEAKALLRLIGEALSIAFPFVGLPNVVPALLGLANAAKERGLEFDGIRRRAAFDQKDWNKAGVEARRTIYSRVGNPEVYGMISQYFPDIAYASTTAMFGYLIGGSLDVQRIELSELTVAAAIVGSGALRQARSHCKGSIGVGNAVSTVKTMVETAYAVAEWNGAKFPGVLDVEKLAAEMV